jgi:hypothetical protein
MDLGEQRMLKKILGVPVHELGEFDPRDPDVAAAMVWLAMHRNRGHNRIITIEMVEGIHPADIEVVTEPGDEETEEAEDAEAGPPPNASVETPPGDSPSHGNGGPPSGSETTPVTSGHLNYSTGSPQ